MPKNIVAAIAFVLLVCYGVSCSKYPTPGKIWKDRGAGIEFCYCPSGTFKMGSTINDMDRTDDQMPQHDVNISQGFWLSRAPITQAQWKSVMNNNPSSFQGDDHPVEMVTWFDCQDFIKNLIQKTGNNKYRLPTEAEWEYACKAQQPEPKRDDLDSIAWFQLNSGSETHSVGQKKANAWGLFDMLGNVRQWCSDYKGIYSPNTVTDPQGPSQGSYRVNRGGSWSCRPYILHAAYRYYYTPNFKDNDLGFRIVLVR